MAWMVKCCFFHFSTRSLKFHHSDLQGLYYALLQNSFVLAGLPSLLLPSCTFHLNIIEATVWLRYPVSFPSMPVDPHYVGFNQANAPFFPLHFQACIRTFCCLQVPVIYNYLHLHLSTFSIINNNKKKPWLPFESNQRPKDSRVQNLQYSPVISDKSRTWQANLKKI